ncbi:MAG: calcium/sodium antiporter [Bacteroidales bacterium]|nr:calcium/sodium antiporter [Bacteroidales bacterium]
MLLSIVLLLVGLGLVVYGSDILVDGASSVARKIGISEFVIGIIIVGFGTSCPELVVSVTGAIDGNSAVSLGNVTGSNIFNILMILGLTAIVSPIAITKDNKTKDIPILLCITIFFCLIALKGTINRLDAVLFLAIFAIYLLYNFKAGKAEAAAIEEEVVEKNYGTFLSILMIVGGLAGLIFGGKLFVNNAVTLAHALGASDKFIAVTILAVGTSLPELMTCVVAAAKKKGQLALGNIVGSNVFNILLILGISGLIHPLDTSSFNYVDMATLTASVLALFIFANASKKSQLSKPAGISFLLMEVVYMIYLFLKF